MGCGANVGFYRSSRSTKEYGHDFGPIGFRGGGAVMMRWCSRGRSVAAVEWEEARRCSDLRPPPCKDVTPDGPLAGTLRAGWRGGTRILILTNTQGWRDHLLPHVFLELSLENFIPDRFYLLFISRLILPFHMILPLRYPLSHSIIVVNCSGVLAFPLLLFITHYFYYFLLSCFFFFLVWTCFWNCKRTW